MRLVLVCVGLLFLLGAPSYAQNSAPETSKNNAAPVPATVSNSKFLYGSSFSRNTGSRPDC